MPDLVATLDKLIHLSDEDKDLLEQHTEKAYAWALETFCVKKYAAALVDIANEIKNPQTLVRLSNYFAYILNQWNSKGISSLNLPNLEIFS
jgi:hypothetical protein